MAKIDSSSTATRSQPCEIASSKPAPPAGRASRASPVRSPRPPPGPVAVQRPCQPVHAHHRRARRQGPVAGQGPPAPARGPARGLLRHPDPPEPPPLLPLSDLPARVDDDLVGGGQHRDGGHGLQRGQVPGSATVPSGTTARCARWWHARQLSIPARTWSTAAPHQEHGTPRTRSKRPQPGDSQAGQDAASRAARSDSIHQSGGSINQ
jgi:hypothetical protein